MLFPIIEISSCPIEPNEQLNMESLYEDVNVNSASDYLSHTAKPDERQKFIENELPGILEGIATVDRVKGTITVRPTEQVNIAIRADLANKLKDWEKKLKSGKLSYDDPRFDGEKYRGHSAMFTLNDSNAQFSGPFAENIAYYGGKTLYIGGVVYAHR